MGFFDKLKKINIFESFANLGSEVTDDFYDELEESLILADTGMDTLWSWYRNCGSACAVSESRLWRRHVPACAVSLLRLWMPVITV